MTYEALQPATRLMGQKSRRSAGRWLVLLICCGLVLPSCSRDDNYSAADRSHSIINRGNGGDPGTLDPVLASDIHAFNILIDLYEGLVAEAADGSLIPGAAKSWQISSDGLIYTFQIREDARWSDGSPVVASDFVDSLQRAVAPETGSPYSFLLSPLENFDAIQSGEMVASGLGVVAESESVLVMILSRPTAHWLSVLAMPVAFPAKFDAVSNDALTNGPYRLVERNIGSTIRLNKNHHYWASSSVEIDEVIFHAIVDPVAEYNMYRTGELDITHIVPSEYVATLRSERPTETLIAPSLALYYLAFDLTEGVFENRALRAALSMAIDRKTIVEVVGRGEQAAFGVVPPGVIGHELARYDWRELPAADRIRGAKSLYAEAGYGPANPLQLKLTYDVGDVHEKVALAVASMWTSELGVEVTLEKLEWKLLLDTRDMRSEWQVMRFAWFGDYNSPETFLEIFESNSLQNLAGYQSEQYDELLAAARLETSEPQRTALMQQAEQELLEDFPIVPLYFFVSKHLVRPGIEGFENNVLDRHPSRFLRIEN